MLNYLEELSSYEEEVIKVIYDKIKGSVVNLVLCEGNFDCCVLVLVKNYVKKNLYFMGVWSKDLKLYVVSMSDKDFFGSEKLMMVSGVIKVVIEFVGKEGVVKVLKKFFVL